MSTTRPITMISHKSRGGRPRKYTNPEDARRANIEGNRRRRQNKTLASGPADFIIFEPPHPNAPIETPASGLRTSVDVRIPLDVHVPQNSALSGPRPISPPSTQQFTANENIEVATRIR